MLEIPKYWIKIITIPKMLGTHKLFRIHKTQAVIQVYRIGAVHRIKQVPIKVIKVPLIIRIIIKIVFKLVKHIKIVEYIKITYRISSKL